MKALVLMVVAAMALSGFTFQQKKKVIFFGDSITEAGVKPGGYITVLGDLMKQRGMDNNFELQGAGIGGNKIYDLYLRADDDVISKKPDVVVIWVGVNDVWHKSMYGTGTDQDKFEKFYDALIKKVKGRKCRCYHLYPRGHRRENRFYQFAGRGPQPVFADHPWHRSKK